MDPAAALISAGCTLVLCSFKNLRTNRAEQREEQAGTTETFDPKNSLKIPWIQTKLEP
jgi:hypothetical protein